MPWFVELQKQYGPKGLQILGVAFEPTDVKDITEFSKDMGVDYPILVGGQWQQQEVANEYGGVSYLPETLYIGRDGKVVEKIIGLNSREEIEASIQRALAQGAAKATDGQSATLQRLGASSVVLVKANAQ
jgi:cytochrome c biogenesis protein CcmG/thiol:disulfide interchange protein DsbE